jgi:hypothetical protein
LDEHKDIETGTYPLIVATDSFGMRGIDYRSKNGITLVIASPFENDTELEQGMSRVGRDGDPYCIAAVKDLKLIDEEKELAYIATLTSFAKE